MSNFPREICSKSVAKNHEAFSCDLCDICVHTKCNKINVTTNNMLQNDETN